MFSKRVLAVLGTLIKLPPRFMLHGVTHGVKLVDAEHRDRQAQGSSSGQQAPHGLVPGAVAEHKLGPLHHP